MKRPVADTAGRFFISGKSNIILPLQTLLKGWVEVNLTTFQP
jgi:hypothetical protein